MIVDDIVEGTVDIQLNQARLRQTGLQVGQDGQQLRIVVQNEQVKSCVTLRCVLSSVDGCASTVWNVANHEVAQARLVKSLHNCSQGLRNPVCQTSVFLSRGVSRHACTLVSS